VASLPKAAEKTASIEPRIETPQATTPQSTPQGFDPQVKGDQPKQAEPRQSDRAQAPEPVEHAPEKHTAPEIQHPQRPKDSPQTTQSPIEQVLPAEVLLVQLHTSAANVQEPRNHIEAASDNTVVAEAPTNEPVPSPSLVPPQPSQNENRGQGKPNSPVFEVHVQAKPREAEVPLKPAAEVEGEPRPNTKVIGAKEVGTATSIAVPRETKHHAIESTAPLETTESTQAAQWTQIEKSNVLNQLIEKARSLRWDRNSEIIVSLKPESLGRISMRASLVDRTMVATIAAESDKVRQILQLDLPVIQRSLQENGIVARVEVSQQSDLNLSQNNPSHGQPRFRQNDSLPFQEEVISHTPAATTEVADARYSTHSVHLIA
jgi:flagellar hook-length control protein FliK